MERPPAELFEEPQALVTNKADAMNNHAPILACPGGRCRPRNFRAAARAGPLIFNFDGPGSLSVIPLGFFLCEHRRHGYRAVFLSDDHNAGFGDVPSPGPIGVEIVAYASAFRNSDVFV